MFNRAKGQRGFTLIELIVALAIMGVLAAIAVPAVLTFVGKGSARGLDADIRIIQNAVDTFKTDIHKGPDAAFRWGQTPARNFYPTKNGLVGTLELDTATTDADFTDRSNYKVVKYVAGPSLGANAVVGDITASLIYFGLMVNEPSADAVVATTPGPEQYLTGGAHPQAVEKGRYLLEFAKSAAAANSASAPTGATAGTYTWVLLQNGKVAPVYLGSDGAYYTGNNGTYP